MRVSITESIANDLRGKISRGEPLPAPLALTPLATHYGVSITPVRLAVEELIGQGYLIKAASGRLSQSRAPGEVPSTELQKSAAVVSRNSQPMWERAFIDEVIRMSLRGDQGYLREEAIAGRFAIGRTVVRQAFNRFAGLGLLIHVPRCGWKVRTFDEADMDAYLAAREAIELLALDLARPHLVRSDLERMLGSNTLDDHDDSSIERLDNDLHSYLLEKSGNHYLKDFFDRHGVYYTSLFDFAAPEAHVVKEMAAQHRTILESLICQDWEGARISLSEHIRAQRPIVAALMRLVGSV